MAMWWDDDYAYDSSAICAICGRSNGQHAAGTEEIMEDACPSNDVYGLTWLKTTFTPIEEKPMLQKFSEEAEKEQILSDLDVSITQWEIVVARGLALDQKQDLTFVHDGKSFDSSRWDSGCLLCQKYLDSGSEDHKCSGCPMYRRWTGGDHCFAAGTPFRQYYNACNEAGRQKARRFAASIALGDLLRARYDIAEMEKPKPLRLRIKSLDDLMKLRAFSHFVFEGNNVVGVEFDDMVALNSEMVNWLGRTLVCTTPDDERKFEHGTIFEHIEIKPEEGEFHMAFIFSACCLERVEED